jgi:SAM-dependent methyltransferase
MQADLAGWLDVLGCPCCQGALRLADDGGLRCPACDERFLLTGDGLPALVRREDAAPLAAFSREYREARLREGRRPLTPKQALNLPYGAPPGYPRLYWEVRRQTYETLVDWLGREGAVPETGAVADLGAGTGWLAHRLARAGYRAVAVEASADADFGLGAAVVYRSRSDGRLLPVQGNLEFPPLRRAALSLVLFNASLHYARDLDRTLARAAAALRPGGWLAVLDSPVARHPRPGTGRGDRHLGREELEGALRGAGLRPRWIAVRRGSRWWVHRVKAAARGDAGFGFPVVVGEKRGERREGRIENRE